MLWLLLLAIVLAQSLISGLWMRQLQKHELDGMLSATRNLANSAAATITFFQSLPLQYRQIALEQLRNMGAAASSSRSIRRRSGWSTSPIPTAKTW